MAKPGENAIILENGLAISRSDKGVGYATVLFESALGRANSAPQAGDPVILERSNLAQGPASAPSDWSYSINGGESRNLAVYESAETHVDWWDPKSGDDDNDFPLDVDYRLAIAVHKNTNDGTFAVAYDARVDNADWDIFFNNTTQSLANNMLDKNDSGDTYNHDAHYHSGGSKFKDDGGLWDADAFGSWDVTFTMTDSAGNLDDFGIFDASGGFQSAGKDGDIRLVWNP